MPMLISLTLPFKCLRSFGLQRHAQCSAPNRRRWWRLHWSHKLWVWQRIIIINSFTFEKQRHLPPNRVGNLNSFASARIRWFRWQYLCRLHFRLISIAPMTCCCNTTWWLIQCKCLQSYCMRTSAAAAMIAANAEQTSFLFFFFFLRCSCPRIMFILCIVIGHWLSLQSI